MNPKLNQQETIDSKTDFLGYIKNIDISSGERILSSNPFWIQVPVKRGIRYKFSGYCKTFKEENRDAALIIFDFGGYEMDQDQLKMYDLKYSKSVGIYAYLPISNHEISVWSYDIPIVEDSSLLRIGFMTWKNKFPVILNENIDIRKDFSFAKNYKELIRLKEENKYLHKILHQEKLAVAKLKRTLSYQLGYLLVHSLKSWNKFFRLPFDLYNLSKNWKNVEIMPHLEGSTKDLDWKEITEKFYKKTISVSPNMEVSLHGKIKISPGEKRFAALVQVEFLGVIVSKESAKRLSLKYSEKLGFYSYLPTNDPSEEDWTVKFRIPDNCRSVQLTFMPWYNNYEIYICLLEENAKEQSKPKISKEYIDKLKTIFNEKGMGSAESYIIDVDIPSYHKADLYVVLASLVHQAERSSEYYWQAYNLDRNYFRAIELFRKVVDGGHLQTAKKILQDFESKKSSIQPRDLRNVFYAKGYVSLYDRLPAIPDYPVMPLSENMHHVMMFLHASLPHHSNGYATRSHAILSTLLHYSKYKIVGLTRSGYPFDVGIKSFEKDDFVDGVHYIRLHKGHYYDQPLDEYMLTAADEIEEYFENSMPTIVHSASAFYTAFPALIASRRVGAPFVYEVRGLWEITRASTIPGWGETERFALESELEAMVAKEADQVIAITGGIKEELIRRGVDAEKISIIPNAINKEHFKPISPDEELRKKIGLNDAPTIGYVGSIVWYEGIEDLLEALVILKKEKIAFNFLLIGDGSALKSIREKVVDLKLEDEVYILGRIPHEEVSAHYALIDITPFPRKSLPVCEMVSPLKPFEAMALKKAVIASNVGALQEIVKDGETGLLFEKDTIEDLAAKLKQLLSDRDLRERLAETGRSWVLSHRDWSQMAHKFDDVYDKAFEINRKRLFEKMKESEENRPVSLLLYGDLNLNFIDGSAIWAASLAEMLTGLKHVSVTFLLKADLQHDTLIESIKRLPNVRIISPSSTSKGLKLLKPEDAVEVLAELQKQWQFDAVIIRSFGITKALAQLEEFRGKLWPYMIDVFHKKEEWDAGMIEEITEVVEASYTVFCQTTHIETFLENKIPSSKGKTSLLPPMVPDQPEPKRHFDFSDRALKIVYAGKFDPLWGTREMIQAFKELRKKRVNVELHVYGDKIHNPPDDPSFKPEIEEALKSTEGIVWHGAQPRKVVLSALRTYDLAWAWRRPELEENTDEVSTKFLEYSSVGLPMLTIGNKITTKLLTDAYPLFVNAFKDLVPTVNKIIKNPELIEEASKLVYAASRPFAFSKVREHYMEALVAPLRSRQMKKTILFAGHDLKFVDKLMAKFAENGYTVLVDKWQNHTKHDEELSKALLSRADIVFCEWALGNAVWYSHNKLPFQKMFVRFHRQEIETAFPGEIDYDAIEKMTFIVPHVLRKTIKKYKLEKYKEKCVFIPNYVDVSELDTEKTDDARFHLGIVGIVPKMKRFDRALDILEGLRKKDKRYQLFVKGKLAKEYPWMQNRTDEMEYYDALDKRIEDSPYLKGAVHYDGFGKDMGAWFSKIGYILSTSDFEGSHLSVAEAMASGATPLIIKWDGADEIYPPKYCFANTSQAVKYVLKETDASFAEHMVENKRFVDEFDIDEIIDRWIKVVSNA